MKIYRYYQDLSKYVKPNKALIIFGPRQIGKTTLLQDYLESCSWKYRLDSGDNLATHEVLSSRNFDALKEYAQGYDLIAIDEAQKIPHIGEALKILVDQVPNLRVIATGSAAFELAGQVGEPLTGRKTSLNLFPIAQCELNEQLNVFDLKHKLEEYLVFGSYPALLTSEGKESKRSYLEELLGSYLLKDILELERVKGSKILLDLLRLLAFQIGKEVSLTEIGQALGINYKTVARYIDLMEKAFVLISVRGFSRNLRKEITKKQKYYFYDNGIRNAVISNFNDIQLRNDIGQLWENFIFIERLKKRSYQNIFSNVYFWRTWNGQEVDIVEERDGELFGYECKWSNKSVKPPAVWGESYSDASFDFITRNNYLNFIC